MVGAPTSVLATGGDGFIRVSFSAPATASEPVITGYIATCTAGSSTLTGSGTESPVTVTGVSNGTTYECRVAATTTSGIGPSSASVTATPSTAAQGAFRGSIVLGVPTASSVRANVYSPDQGGVVSISYGTVPGDYSRQTTAATLTPDLPLEIPLEGLFANTRYYYRLNFQAAAGGSGPTQEYAFHTARPPGATFVFALQGDSHPERVRQQFDSTLYTRTLRSAAASLPDFYVMLGDDFSVDQINQANPAAVTQSQVRQRYLIQRPYLGLIGTGSPIFLVNGNHEQAARYLLNGTPNSVAVWAQNARNSLFSQPAPDAFYSGNTEQVPNVGLLRNYYAFTWGDALFVMIDPYWSSPVAVDNNFFGDEKRADLWSVTHGDEQYTWLKRTLEQSTARYKFVFAHHVLGSQRGGIEVAPLYEWGGQNPNGQNVFAAHRSTWAMPIHQLFVANRVTAFFQGHDHIWVHQQLDGVTYQTVSQPADPNYSLFNADAYLTGDKYPNSGYTRVTVGPGGVRVEYVRTYLAADERPGRTAGTVALAYTIP